MNTASSTITGESVRYEFLDWLRVIAIFVLLFFHTGMLFVGWGWHIENADTMLWLQWPMDIAHRLRMPLLFLIAGASLWFVRRSRSLAAVLRERTLRLLVPLVFGMFVIVAPQVYIERLFHGQFVGGYLEFFFTRVLELRPYPDGDFSWHHLWFIAYLYVYVVALIPALFWWKHARIQLRPGLWLFALGVPLGVNEALLKPFFPEAHNLVGDWYIFNHYLLLTIYGFLLASVSGSWDWLERRRRIALGLALTVLIGALASFRTGVIERDTAADALIANLFTWFSLMTFLGYGRRYLSYSNRLLVWARDASYPIYILHQTVIIVLAWYIVAQPWSAGVKYVVVLIATMLACVLIYEVCIRRFGVMRLAFGMKRESRSAAGQNTRLSASRVLIR